MAIRKIVEAAVGVILVVCGAYFTFRPKLSYQKESVSDIYAIVGIILMIVGVVLLFAPLLG